MDGAGNVKEGGRGCGSREWWRLELDMRRGLGERGGKVAEEIEWS